MNTNSQRYSRLNLDEAARIMLLFHIQFLIQKKHNNICLLMATIKNKWPNIFVRAYTRLVDAEIEF